MGNLNKIFKTVIDPVTPIILYVLLLELLVGVINILLNIKSALFRTLRGFFNQIVFKILRLLIYRPFQDFCWSSENEKNQNYTRNRWYDFNSHALNCSMCICQNMWLLICFKFIDIDLDIWFDLGLLSNIYLIMIYNVLF